MYTFARVSAVVTMKVQDYRVSGPRADIHALQVVKRRCATANLPVDICCHSFRGSGTTLYLQRGGLLPFDRRKAPSADPSPKFRVLGLGPRGAE